MTSPSLRVEVRPIAEIVLCRPEQRNAMSVEMGDRLAEAVERLNASEEVRVVLVRGEGKAFCAGGDFDMIAENTARSPEENRVRMLAFYRRYLSVLRLRTPSIAVVHGAAIGAGLCLAMACDVRFAAREAKLGANFVRVGLHPGMGCSLLLSRLVGPARAAELLFSGRLVDGAEAERMGLVNAAAPRGELDELVARTAEEIASAAPIAVAQLKATLAAPLARDLDDALAREAGAQAIDFATEDLKEAVAAFRAGREPQFTGR